jgi:hypothetical protein
MTDNDKNRSKELDVRGRSTTPEPENCQNLILKAFDNARNGIHESIKLQYHAVKIGLTFLALASALAGFLYKTHPLLAMLTLQCVGFLACGFMYLILGGEIRIMRAGEFCKEMEGIFHCHPCIELFQS